MTIRTDCDGDGSYETLEHADAFSAIPDALVETRPDHDAAGNLTYDGLFHYSFDAWNRLVKATRAYKDDQGTLHVGGGRVSAV